MPKHKDITGVRSGKLVAVEYVGPDKNGASAWRCSCDCGGSVIVAGSLITLGKQKAHDRTRWGYFNA